jgi:uracil-DNA glycosylase
MEEGWKNLLIDEFSKPYFAEIRSFLKAEIAAGKKLYPPSKLIFNAFDSCPLNTVKVVIIGQDPYHGPGQAMGLSFSVPHDVRVPPSLKNIYKELHTDIGMEIPNHGDLSSWSKQGVFLLNAILTVEHKKAGSHRKLGWQKFTDSVITKLSEHKKNIVFLLWGNFAKSKEELIDSSKHLVLTAAHPSPLARGAFFGSKHFSKSNAYLIEKGLKPITWNL